MTKRFFQTIAANNVEHPLRMRVNLEKALIFHIIQQFNCKDILEIGFYRGDTFGVFVEATPEFSNLTAIDIDLNVDKFNNLYQHYADLSTKSINLLQADSLHYTPTMKYDFINIDGNHNYHHASNDLNRYINFIKPTGILMVDDFSYGDVDTAIDEFMAKHSDWKPFLMGVQSIFFHHVSHEASDFLDNYLNMFSAFCSLYNIDYKNNFVKKIECMPVITDNDDVFRLVCKIYNI